MKGRHVILRISKSIFSTKIGCNSFFFCSSSQPVINHRNCQRWLLLACIVFAAVYPHYLHQEPLRKFYSVNRKIFDVLRLGYMCNYIEESEVIALTILRLDCSFPAKREAGKHWSFRQYLKSKHLRNMCGSDSLPASSLCFCFM